MEIKITQNAEDCVLKFHDRLGNAAAIDLTKGPLRFEPIEGAASMYTFDTPRPGASTGEFLVNLTTLGVGVGQYDIIADSDLTPDTEKELRDRVTLSVLPGDASSMGFSMGRLVEKPAEEVPPPAPPTE